MNILCFVHLPLLIKLLSILHSNALLGRLVYVLIGLSGESVHKTKLKVTASYTGTTANLNAMSTMTIGTISQHSTVGNH